MSLLADALIGKQIDAIHVDSEVTYIMLTNGTQLTIKGMLIVEPNWSGFVPGIKTAAEIVE